MFILPKLQYSFDALEPYIDKETMQLHHDKHHGAYVDKLNAVLEGHERYQKMTIEELLMNIEDTPLDIRQAVINNGGGHANHSFFWEILRPAKNENTTGPKGEFSEVLKDEYGNFEDFKKSFTEKALAVFGSGWAFLVMTPKKQLKLKRHSFQNSPLMHRNIPILGIDLWEHAYYLKYQNRRAEYIEAWWNVLDWDKVSENFAKALQKV